MAERPANVSRLEFTVKGLPADLRVLSLHGEEALSEPFRYQLELVCPAASPTSFVRS